MTITKACRNHLIQLGYAEPTWTDENLFSKAAVQAVYDGKLTSEEFDNLQAQKSPTPADVFGKGGNARVKKPSERYSTTKTVAKHAKSGQPVKNEKGREVETVSELETAKIGAFLKSRAARDGLSVSLNEHERSLIDEMYANDDWCGRIDGEYKTGIEGMRVKALLNDSTSGGGELVPEFFDDAVIQFPLLHSELLPRVDIRDVPKGSSVETASIGNPSVVWGVGEGTSLTPFDTASLVAGIDTSIHPVACAVEIGRDLMSDSAVDVGRILLENIGQKMLSELDRVICVGNGTTQPQGIANASGMTDIGNPSGGAGAAPAVDDIEALIFSLGKQYRVNYLNPSLIGTDTSYRRARGIPVSASDERRVFGMTHNDYKLLDYPFVINNSLPNNFVAFGCLKKYRLYRRQAQEVRFTDQGKELALKNQVLLVVRGRFGGRVMDGAAFAYTDNAQA